MTLRRRAQLVVLISGLVFLALLALLLVNHREHTQSERDLALTNALSLEITQVRTALFGYLLHPENQPRVLVEAQFENLDRLLTRETASIAEIVRRNQQIRHAWEDVRRLTDEMRTLFAELTGSTHDPRFAERDERTTNLIVVDSHALILLVRQIRYQANLLMLAASGRESLTLGLMLVGMAGLGLGTFLTC